MNVTGNAIVIGGGGGIGQATAVAFAQAGAAGVLIADINFELAQEAVKVVKGAATRSDFRVEAVHVDVTVQESVQSVMKHMVDSFGRIDYCVICAGVGVKMALPTEEASVSEFLRMQSINVTGTFFVIQASLAIMKTQEARPNFPEMPSRGITRGTVVALGSVLSVAAAPRYMQYTTSKHAVLGMVKSAALDCVEDGIRVNCVCPTWVETNMTKQLRLDIPGLDAAMAPSVPMGRIGRPEEIADAVLFLCSPRSSFITGIPLVIDGGSTISGNT
ncbi:NAD(P)-binding protein [Hypoxylon sp. NC1633]|nr:NAD(P)-binding protein [Hypoxylon sp. NC1633]